MPDDRREDGQRPTSDEVPTTEASAAQQADETDWPTHSASTPEGVIQGLGRMASEGARSPGWKRKVAVGALVLFLVPVLLLVLDLVLDLF